MPKNIVVCLDGTNNKIRSACNTNVVKLFELLDLRDPTAQVAYYDPGVGTFSSPAAWTPAARTVSRYAGLAFGAGLRQNLGEAYGFLVRTYEPGDQIFLCGFSRGAYSARALAGLLEVFGIFRRSSENLVPYAVSEYALQESRSRDWRALREYARIHGTELGPGLDAKDHAPVRFMGIWDTVKSAGNLWRQLSWPWTRQLPHVAVVRHAVAIDERRRHYEEYLVDPPDPDHLIPTEQDRAEVWFAGVHSDVGGTFEQGPELSRLPLKWMAEEAVAAGLLVRPRKYAQVQRVDDSEATGPVHGTDGAWGVLGWRQRPVPPGALVHASVQRRIAVDPSYADRLPGDVVFVDADWAVPRRRRIPSGSSG